MRVRALAVSGVSALAVAAAFCAPPAVAAPPAAPAAQATTALIVHTARTARQLKAALARQDRTATVHRVLVPGATVSVRVPTTELAAQRSRLAALPGVTSVEPPVERRLADFTPDDPGYPRQAGYLTSVQAPAAWARQHGSPAVRIAVIDSGVDVTHPDLAGKVVATYNALDPASPAVPDPLGHGTFVAGVAAAGTDNGRGVAGAGFDTDLMAVKVAGSVDDISIDDEIAGIRWAADHGADIVNLSIGGTDYSRSEAQAVVYAQHRGALVVAAAGNDGDDTPQYPAAYPGVVAVGAIDTAAHTRADFSSFGPWVTLAAPGVELLSTTPRRSSQFPAGRYAKASGTSFSAPLVSGAAALLLAQNPQLDAGEVRADLIRSSHGFSHLGLGAGQVDLARALAHVRPSTVPDTVVTFDDHDDVTVSASSTATAVEFALDGGSWSAPVTVRRGVARTVLATAGYADGPHLIRAVDCTSYGECNPTQRTTSFDLVTDAPTVTSPRTGARLTGVVTVRAARPDGGTLRLLVDGVPRGVRRAAPYSFALATSALADGAHTLAVQLCSADGTRCDGPVSPTVNVTSAALHPRLGAPTPARISPNGDGVLDAAAVVITLPDTETVTARVLRADGTVVARDRLGTLRAGRHMGAWRGLGAGGRRLPDGRYTLAISTSRGALRGSAATSGVVDTVAPSIAVTAPTAATFYPYPDGYRDTTSTTVTLGVAGVLRLAVVDARGHTVRTILSRRAAGRAGAGWNGVDARGHRVAAGRYLLRFSVTDAAGNTRTARAIQVVVSSKRLHRTTVAVTLPADGTDGAGGSASCARVSTRASAYRHGALFTNACPADDYEIAFARYTFTVPKAVRYGNLSLNVLGRSGAHGSQLTAAFERSDGVVEVPGYVTVKPGAARRHTITTVPGSDLVTSGRQVGVSVVLTGEYRGANTLDAADVQLRIGLVVLR